jgi:hypothetical protein
VVASAGSAPRCCSRDGHEVTLLERDASGRGRVGLHEPALAREFDARTETDVAPWFHAQIAVDRARYAQIEALCEGREPPAPADELATRCVALFTTMTADPDLFRAALEYIGTLTPI